MTRTKANGSVDVLIIGAGAAGSVAAKHLAAAGFDTLCLEQGHRMNSDDFPSTKPESDLLTQGPWHPNPNIRGRTSVDIWRWHEHRGG